MNFFKSSTDLFLKFNHNNKPYKFQNFKDMNIRESLNTSNSGA